MAIKDSSSQSNPLSAMLRHGLNIARTRSPASSKKSQTPPIEIRRPSEEERAFRGIKSSLSTSPSSTASSMSTRSFGGGSSPYSNSSPRSDSARMGFGRQSRRRMGNTGVPKTLSGLPASRSTSSLGQLALSPPPRKSSRRRSDHLVSFLDFDSDEEGQDLFISASVSSASSSQGALTPSDSGSFLSDSDHSTGAMGESDCYGNALSKLDDDADHIIDAISLRLRLNEPETNDGLLNPRSGKMFTDAIPSTSPFAQPSSPHHYTLNGNRLTEASSVKTEYISPSSAPSSPFPLPPVPSTSSSPSSVVSPGQPKGLEAALAEDAGGVIPLTFSSLLAPFDDSRRPSEVSLASVSTAVSDLTIDASTGVARRKSSIYDANFFETIVSPTLDLFPSPPPSASSTPASTPSKPSPLSRVDEENETPSTPTTPTATVGTPSIETLLGISASPGRATPVRRPRTPPLPPPPAAVPPPPVPPLPLIDDFPSRVILSAEAPARPRRAAPPAPLRFGVGTKFQLATHGGALRRAPSILSPTAPSELSSPAPVSSPFERGEVAPLSQDEEIGDNFFEMYSPEFEMVMKVGGLEDINEEECDESSSPDFFSSYPVSPDTAAAWAKVAEVVTAGVAAQESRTSTTDDDDRATSQLPYAI